MMQIDERTCCICQAHPQGVPSFRVYAVIGIFIHFVSDVPPVEKGDILHDNEFTCDVALHACYGIECIIPSLLIDSAIYFTFCLERLIRVIIGLYDGGTSGKYCDIEWCKD